MASFRRQKEALRAVVYAFVAGAHCVTEEVEKAQSLSVVGSGREATQARHEMLETDFRRLLETPKSIELLSEILDEEELYPFGSEWPREALLMVLSRVIPPELSLSGEESERKFRFRKGFKKILADMAGGIESFHRNTNTLDHWLTLLINTTFHTGMTLAARNAENSKAYYAAIQQIEEETEAWNRYPQLLELLDRQLRRETRRRTGLVSDLDY